MHTYGFLLGKTPLLSLAELTAVLNDAKIVHYQPEIAIFKVRSRLNNAQILQNHFGGTIKIIEIVSQATDRNNLLNKIISLLKPKSQGKFNFALNLYGKIPHFYQKRLLLDIKKALKRENIASRFANNNFQNLSSVAIKKENLIRNGADINIIFIEKTIYIGATITVQDIDAYNLRDYEKPCRDAKSGMIPPKLAQILINIAKPMANTFIYDPFCGSGTILMEALLMGHSVIGSDISQKAVSATTNNIHWLENIYPQIQPLSKTVLLEDSTLINQSHLKDKNEIIIVTEPYLGPPCHQIPTESQIQQTFQTLKVLYIKFFTNIAKNHPSIKTIIIIFPYIKTKHKNCYLNINQELKKLGFEPKNVIPMDYQQKHSIETNANKSLYYERPNQIVGREIYKFIKQHY